MSCHSWVARSAFICFLGALSLASYGGKEPGLDTADPTAAGPLPSRLSAVPGSIPSGFLYGSDRPGRAELLIDHYDVANGLLAAYITSSGKRILIRAWRLPNGAPIAEVAHLNEQTGQIELAVGLSRDMDPASGLRKNRHQVAGVDVLAHARAFAAKRATPSADNAVGRFMLSDAGRAFAQAVPALYAAMEIMNVDETLVDLPAVLGATLTTLQLSTGIYGGFDDADEVLGEANANALRAKCGGDCRMAGRYFTIQSSGLFDALSKSRSIAAFEQAQGANNAGTVSLARRFAGSNTRSRFLKNGDGDCTDPGPCFGMCGPGCITPGDISTQTCLGHDACVCAYGWGACVTNPGCTVFVPDIGFVECSGLIDAILDYLDAMARKYLDVNQAFPDGDDWWDW